MFIIVIKSKKDLENISKLEEFEIILKKKISKKELDSLDFLKSKTNCNKKILKVERNVEIEV